MKSFRKTRESAKIAARRKELLELTALEKRYTVFSEYWSSQREGYGLEVARIREFDFEDDPEDIDLAGLAIGERDVVVRQALEGVVLMMFADVSSSLTYYPDHFEYSKGFIRDIAVSLLINSAHQMMSPIGLVTFSDKIEKVFPPQSGTYALYVLNRFLSEEPKTEDAGTSLACLAPYAREFQDAMICLISDFEDRSFIESWLADPQISQLDLVPVIIRDPLEKVVIPAGTQLYCRSPEGEKAHSRVIGGRGFAFMQEESERYYSEVCQMLRSLHATPVVLDTASIDDCHKKLSRFFAEKLATYR